MVRAGVLVVLTIVSLSGLGCAMCCSPDLETYPTIGGRVERSDPVLGRAGSNVSDPWMTQVSDEPVWLESEITPSTTDQMSQFAQEAESPRASGSSTRTPRQPITNGWR